MRISSSFDSGNMECLDCSQPTDTRLAIKKDHNSDFYQWFHFRLVGARDPDCTLRIMNAGGAAYPKGWEGYRAVGALDQLPSSFFADRRDPRPKIPANLTSAHP